LEVSELRNPEPTVTKFGMGDYVGDMTQHAKIQTDQTDFCRFGATTL